ncbi:hypothetical protein [Actinomyces sp.]|uniref:hypothetical protein n=1 Tax=Actinomyces sp. TaxID=29317 RepID=UPI0029139C08|nr:hypothetical protein [Actinomyces sp.]MDU5231517.1 hypothetical protein [Actinomyces sp.]MDU6756939.1 hypothetical protein [Actinomyces sp.]
MTLPTRLVDQPRTAIAALKPRMRAVVSGRVVAITYPIEGASMTLRAHLKDDTGTVIVAWPGRREIPGVHVGAHMVVQGNVMQQFSEQLLWNPHFQILGDDDE